VQLGSHLEQEVPSDVYAVDVVDNTLLEPVEALKNSSCYGTLML
jgi:hypothetical protein